MTPRQVGRLLGFKPRTVTRWCREGKIKGAVKVGRVWRIPYDSSTVHLELYKKRQARRAS